MYALNSRLTSLLAATALLVGLPGSSWALDSTPQELVEQYLNDLGATSYTITAINDDYVARSFPDMAWFGVYFPQYPLSIEPPEGLASSNLFFVLDNQVYYLKGSGDLDGLFMDLLLPVQDEDGALDAGRSWLRLSQEFSQDGYFTFDAPKVELIPAPTIGLMVRGYVAVSGGGEGAIDMAMTFDADGQVIDIQEVRSIMPGIRPL
jgi:hypothetical protein